MNALLRMVALSVLLAFVAGACSATDTLTERASDLVSDSASDRLAERSRDTMSRLEGLRGSEIDVVLSETVTLEQLQAAGIPVGSNEIRCDQPLHLVMMRGAFDTERLLDGGIPLSAHPEEALAMRLVAEIYNPETDMPLGIIGDSTGNSLGGLLQDSSIGGDASSGNLVLDTSGAGETGHLVPEAVCR